PAGWRRDVWVAVLAGPLGTVASHTTAAALYSLLDPPRAQHVTVPRQASGQRGDATVHHASVDAADRDRVDGIPTTAVARTIVDCATILDQPALNRLTDAAIGRGFTTLEGIRSARGRAGALAGAARLREALAPYAGGIPPGSVKEAHALRLFRQWKLPPPECQYVIRNERGEFVAQVDFAWPLFRLALEYDGDEAHAPRKWSADDDRAETIEALGWRVERADRHDLRPSSTRLRALLTHLLRQPA
ncbi:MAG TPA: hypothetical protein VGR20_04500, partial [Acidimicrobiia bacterium]|nr:hypothetical protein [Acidimicrobiia bacterium]